MMELALEEIADLRKVGEESDHPWDGQRLEDLSMAVLDDRGRYQLTDKGRAALAEHAVCPETGNLFGGSS